MPSRPFGGDALTLPPVRDRGHTALYRHARRPGLPRSWCPIAAAIRYILGPPPEARKSHEARYFTSEEEAAAYVEEEHPAGPINLAGAWSDLDWAEAEAALDRIRHDSAPTPPIDSI